MSKRKIIAATLLVALAAGALIFLLSVPRKPEVACTLPDGSKLRVVKVDYGTRHFYNYGHRFRDLLYSVVPARYRTNFNFQVASLSTTSSTPVIWLERTGMSTNRWFSPNSMGTTSVASLAEVARLIALNDRVAWPLQFSIFDGAGFETSSRSFASSWKLTGGTNEVMAFALGDYPRRAEMLGIRIHTTRAPPLSPWPGEYMEAVLDLRLPNPKYVRNNTVWVNEPIPAVRKTNGLEIVLDKFEAVKMEAAFDIKLRENGLPATNWNVLRISATNAIGDGSLVNSNRRIIQEGYFGRIWLESQFWAYEPAWRVKVELARTPQSPPGQASSNSRQSTPPMSHVTVEFCVKPVVAASD